MGTTWRVHLVAAPALRREPVRLAIQSALDEVVAQMSSWEPDSDLGRFNRAAAGSWHALPAHFHAVLACAREVAERSAGAFDPTAGALVDAWGFGPAPRHGVPDAAMLSDARRAAGWHRLDIDPARRALRQPGGLALDLSAIAKGFGVDLVAHRLQALGIADHLVDVGGELRGAGVKPDGQPWWVELEQPDGDRGGERTLLALHDLSVATSGDYRRWFEHEGTRYSHTIDPRDGRPIRHGLASVTVIHADCMHADAWSTALNVLGPDPAVALADRLGLAARTLVRDGAGFVERRSAAFDALLR
ncbi:MAG: FAD:protein FMN transferase [Burkholderiales bacterium]|nr:FAD:protein FMN transferase [Burkholderiales bacterium]